ncbi:putative C6 zinc finger domain-containing protein [Rosellinia necatrix]|uniref:Putative C6 zinc finger domain-containing protein n=1 Tax=Rosellinia necatrix TaxID=77044 RepID=A0A1W2TW62_ROSNE|nr:putative C6 zinc finger domain-containing protein [Rosellinia necatrix]
MDSPCVLEALLQVSAVASGYPVETVTRRGAGMFHLQAMSNPPGVDSPSSALRMIACFVLARTLLFVDVIPDSWERTFQGTGAFLYFRRFTFADTVERRVWLSFLTLVTRLEVAYCLMNQLAPNWISGLAHQIQEQSEISNTRDNIPQRILDTSIRCLRLLIDAMNISFTVPEASDDATAPPGEFDPSHFNQRNELMDRLDAWQRSRPPDLKPLIEVDHPKGNFPTIIFTSGAGISANIIYHTAMALLLRNKQDSTSTDEHGEALEMVGPQESPDWHAQRVCGIAINSEPEHARCWDPIMIAAFWLATQGLNLRSQQDQVLVCLSQLKAAGWHIDILINKLHEKWGHAN